MNQINVVTIGKLIDIRVTTVSRGKLFWMKQSNRLCIMRQVGTNPKS